MVSYRGFTGCEVRFRDSRKRKSSLLRAASNEAFLFSTDDADGADMCRSCVFRPYGFDIQK